jgi:hypothetical protein
MEARKKVIVHINNISPEVLDMVHEKYPDGYQDHIFKVTKPNNDFFYAFTLDAENTSYLIKVDVKIDSDTSDKIDEQIFSVDEGIVAEIKPDDEDEEEKEKSSKKSDEDDF